MNDTPPTNAVSDPKLANLIASWLPTVGKTLLGVLWASMLWIGNTAWELYKKVEVLDATAAAQVESNTALGKRLEAFEARLVQAHQTSIDLLVATKVIEGKLPFFLRVTKNEFDDTKSALFSNSSAPHTLSTSTESNQIRNVLTAPLPMMAMPPAP